MRYLLILLVLGGCTICESPYIEQNGNCCLDTDNDSVCDDIMASGRVTNEPAEPQITQPQEKIQEFELNMQKVKVSTIEYKPTESEDLSFFVSTPKYPLLKSVHMSFMPQCGEAHELYVSVNGEQAGKIAVDCNNAAELDIPLEIVEVGANIVELVGKTGTYMIRNVTISLDFGEIVMQSLPKTVIEVDTKQKVLANEGNVRLSNFYELDFELDFIRSGVNMTFTVPKEGRIIIILNNHVLLDDLVEEDIEIELPEEFLAEKNTIKIIAGAT